MEPIEFACILDRITKKININIDENIIEKIYDIYEGNYENYTLLELINLLELEKLDYSWNKKVIIEIIKNEKLNIPKKFESLEPTGWIYNINTYNRSYNDLYQIDDKIYTNSIYIDKTYFSFNVNDIFNLNNKNYRIYDIQSKDEIISMYLKNTSTNELSCIIAEDFIYALDHYDITILQNIDRCLFYY